MQEHEDVVETKVGVLDKAMAILTVFTRGENALLPQEIAARTNMALPTVYRLAQALCEHGMLMKDGPRFRLGLTLLRLGMRVAEGIDVRQQAQKYLKWLNEQTDENAELHVRHEETRLVIEVVSSPHNLRAYAEIGTPLPLHQGAAGKVLLAWLPAEERLTLARASAERFSPQQPFDLRTYADELDRARARGWASSEGERSTGVSSLAAPIFNAGELVAGAIALVAPSSRLTTELRQRFIPIVSEAARRTSYDLGYVR